MARSRSMQSIWIVFWVALWNIVASFTQTSTIQYVKLKNNINIMCPAKDEKEAEKGAYWYRQRNGTQKFEFVIHISVISRETRGPGITNRFKGSKRDSMKPTFTLKISDLHEEDIATYYCALFTQTNLTMESMTKLILGDQPTTPPPIRSTVRTKKYCVCRNLNSNNLKSKGAYCLPKILGPLLGTAAVLCILLVCTLYYFSKLPKKCRHGMITKKQIR
ncbi:uncharacterized protein cd8b [Erpetoichthys calabaricus]|uniref:Uncharacterized LOC114654234 n=1 Tax=Erpetoichthys calabaricus TaxID=27687 RepID=A0A8C4SAN8_ERPCA|nr:uncharacterized protein cd8b [Erpetoichthys calabaricus]